MVKALEKVVFNPCTRKSANIGHPSRGKGLAGKARDLLRNQRHLRLRRVLLLIIGLLMAELAVPFTNP